MSTANYLSFRYLPNATNVINSPKVSILIPARNEEQNIGVLLKQLGSFSYSSLEVIVYNDNSTDKTADIVKFYANSNENIKLLEGSVLPKGWLGKNHACHNLAKEASGDIFLFLDADVNVKNGLIESSLSYFKKHDLHLLSIFPKQIFKSIGEKISVPLMNWILLSLLPLIFVRIAKNSAFAAANGQFMMFRSDTYKKILPHKLLKFHKVEDIAIIKHFKKQALKSDTLLGNKYTECRMYSRLPDAIEGFTKNIFHFFNDSIALTILVGVLTTIAPFIVFMYLGTLIGVTYLIGIVFVRVFVSLASKQSVFQNLIFMIPQHIIFLLIIAKGIVNHKKKTIIWKGRNILQE